MERGREKSKYFSQVERQEAAKIKVLERTEHEREKTSGFKSQVRLTSTSLAERFREAAKKGWTT